MRFFLQNLSTALLLMLVTAVTVVSLTQVAILTSQPWATSLVGQGFDQIATALSLWWEAAAGGEPHPLHPLGLFAVSFFLVILGASRSSGAVRIATILILLASALFCLALAITAQLVVITTWDGGTAGGVLWRLAAVLLALFSSAVAGTLATAFELAAHAGEPVR